MINFIEIERFWRKEDMQIWRSFLKKRSSARNFSEMSKRTINGRFEVSLPFREDPNILGESNVNALKRLRYLKRTFQKDPQLQIQYISFMEYQIYQAWLHVCIARYQGHELSSAQRTQSWRKNQHQQNSEWSFDASKAFGKSLNDCLLMSPTIQPEFDTLLWFRQYILCDRRYCQDVYTNHGQVRTPIVSMHIMKNQSERSSNNIQSKHDHLWNCVSTVLGHTFVARIIPGIRDDIFLKSRRSG